MEVFEDYMARENEHIFQLAMQEAVTASACTVVKYATRAVKATFLTRWYWDRKARKAYKAFFDVCDYVKNQCKCKTES